jgi:N-acetylglucosamine malate deacetylase 1
VRLPRPIVRLVARAKPLVPASAWPWLATMRSLAGDRPMLVTPSFRRVLVLSAHPDDETCGCGGLMALLASRGCEVHVVSATSGEGTIGSSMSPAETAGRRCAELARACEVLGARPPRFLSQPDGGVDAAALAPELRAVVAEVAPEAVFVPWFLDGHRDHQAVARALASAGLGDDVEVWGYETWTPLPANRLVDITPVFETKQRALAAHETAHLAFDVSAILGINRYRSAHAAMGAGYVEGFLVAPAREWFALAERARAVEVTGE